VASRKTPKPAPGLAERRTSTFFPPGPPRLAPTFGSFAGNFAACCEHRGPHPHRVATWGVAGRERNVDNPGPAIFRCPPLPMNLSPAAKPPPSTRPRPQSCLGHRRAAAFGPPLNRSFGSKTREGAHVFGRNAKMRRVRHYHAERPSQGENVRPRGRAQPSFPPGPPAGSAAAVKSSSWAPLRHLSVESFLFWAFEFRLGFRLLKKKKPRAPPFASFFGPSNLGRAPFSFSCFAGRDPFVVGLNV